MTHLGESDYETLMQRLQISSTAQNEIGGAEQQMYEKFQTNSINSKYLPNENSEIRSIHSNGSNSPLYAPQQLRMTISGAGNNKNSPVYENLDFYGGAASQQFNSTHRRAQPQSPSSKGHYLVMQSSSSIGSIGGVATNSARFTHTPVHEIAAANTGAPIYENIIPHTGKLKYE